MRNLVSVQKIIDIQPIENADNILCASILGWKLVILKDEFKIGDKCAYFEVDSFLPIEEKYEFLRKSSYRKNELVGEGFRIKTQKLRGQISQGLALNLNTLGLSEDLEIGTDLTNILNVKKWEVPEKISNEGILIPQFPDGIDKTDETRIQTIPEILNEFKGIKYYISTKIDGTSVTMYRKNGKFGICSHDNEIIEDENHKNSFWEYSRKIEINEKLKEANIDNIAIQGEFAGCGIQKNRLNLKEFKWFVFTIKDLNTGKRIDLPTMLNICKILNLETVPIEEVDIDLPSKYPNIESLLIRAQGLYSNGSKKEGIVIRPVTPIHSNIINGDLSFKVLNNIFLLKE